MAREAGQSAASCDFGAIVAWHEAMRVSKLGPIDGALYPRDENLLAEPRGVPLRPPKVGASIGGVRAALAWRGRGAVEVERREDSTNKIMDDDGGEATGAFAVQSYFATTPPYKALSLLPSPRAELARSSWRRRAHNHYKLPQQLY